MGKRGLQPHHQRDAADRPDSVQHQERVVASERGARAADTSCRLWRLTAVGTSSLILRLAARSGVWCRMFERPGGGCGR
jgi:hypothetical protein